MPHGRYLFVSDLHLDATAPAAIAQFLHFLDTDAAQCDGLYILGDLFESWIGDDDDEPSRALVCDGLRALTGRGVPCRVQHGNRDFLLGAGFAARTGCVLAADPEQLDVGGKRIVISHGDALCTADTSYQRFRRMVRSRAFQRPWLALPLAARRGLAACARRRSYAHTRRLPVASLDVAPDAVTQLLRATNADILIHGHTHRPGVHRLEVDGRERTRIVLGDWYVQGSVLTLHADGRLDSRGLAARPSAPAHG
ncbi:MAG TPA: UDP-2,3-diacylglucosamine diphosphatase [Steroidobacteraceae bacterium]|nr:UDP-2,3-diacylglucosamine diphosphatase [Steroidobacteraceae bacterium]